MKFIKGKWYRNKKIWPTNVMITFIHMSETIDEDETTYSDTIDIEISSSNGFTIFNVLYSPHSPEILTKKFSEADEEDFKTIIQSIFMSRRVQIR